MRKANISERVCYIGVNDRTSDKFESMWPLPLGVSYNSYIVIGSEKTAVIDGVSASHATEQIARINELLQGRKPDYLIINHMEPDHSGSMELLRQAFPEITVVGNAITLGYIKGYYGESARQLAVKDGDTLSLGPETTLRFAMIPMVHWPETMATYLEEEQLLFSGDAFGCFGALNGAVLDTDMNTDRYMPEMERYYTNIVGRYGAFVQKALKKLSQLEIHTVCPTHGPVWRSRLSEVYDLYDRLSRYEPLDNGVTIVYGSMYGNTEIMAEIAAETLAAEGIKDISIINAARTHISYTIAEAFRHRGLIIAAPTYSDTLFPPVTAVLEALSIRNLSNREVAIIGGHTWSPQAIKGMQAIIATSKLHETTEAVKFKQMPDNDALEECRRAARAIAKAISN